MAASNRRAGHALAVGFSAAIRLDTTRFLSAFELVAVLVHRVLRRASSLMGPVLDREIHCSSCPSSEERSDADQRFPDSPAAVFMDRTRSVTSTAKVPRTCSLKASGPAQRLLEAVRIAAHEPDASSARHKRLGFVEVSRDFLEPWTGGGRGVQEFAGALRFAQVVVTHGFPDPVIGRRARTF